MELDRLLRPRSVAVVGATERPGAYGSEALLNLSRLGFTGRVYAVNPGRDVVHGVACHPSLAALPEAPDAVVVAIPAEEASAVVEDAGALRCGGAVVFAAGFAEARDGGPARQEALVAAARRHGLPVCGPNGNGIVSLAARAPLWGDMVAPADPGPVALISQSGNLAVNALASRRGLRLHTVVSCGNQAVLAAEDYLLALAAADGVRSVALYLEAQGNGTRWCEAFEACARAGIGVAVLKAGATALGAAAAEAHTGAVAGDGRAFRAFVEECGAAWASDPHELLELAKALAPGRRSPGGGTAVMTCSGGDASVAADLAAELGVSLPAPAPETAAAMEAVLPAAARPQNPLDYTSLLWDDPEAVRSLVVALAADAEVGRVLVLYDQPPDMDAAAAESWATVLRAVRAGARDAEAPVLVASTLPELLDDAVALELMGEGIPALAGLRSGLAAAATLSADPPDPARLAELASASRHRRAAAGDWLAEHEAKSLLARAGVPVPEGFLAPAPADAAAAYDELGGEVAVKLSSPDVRHKSQLGALALNLPDRDAVRVAAERIVAVGIPGPLLVERMVAPGAELLVAARADAVVPVLVVGLGGVWTEALDDVVVIPLPASPARVERALRSLRGAAALTGDIHAAASLAAHAGDVLLRRDLALLELNPVIVHERGAVVVDALARRGSATAEDARPEAAE